MARSKAQPFHQILKRERRRHGWTQSTLAERLGIDANTVSRWERGTHTPFPIFRTKLSDLLGMPLEELGLLDEESEGIAPLFLCYAQADEPFAMHLKQDLAYRELHLVSDVARESATSEQQEIVHKALQDAHAVILLASPQTPASPAVQEELRLAEQYGCPVCVLWIAGERRQDVLPPLQTAVRALDLIDARPSHYEQALDALLAKLLALPPPSFRGADILVVESMVEPRNPYKGLRAFHYEDASDFFGRERLIDGLVDTLEQCLTRAEQRTTMARFLAVIGPSGSGKSSAVLAGLLPRLHLDELPGSGRWVYLPAMVPGKHPLESLAATLGHALRERSLLSIREDLEEESGRGLHMLATYLTTPTVPTVVLVVDQFEELFTQTTGEVERQHFIRLLVTACTEPAGPLLLILTLRGDFYDRPMYYPEIGSLIEQQSRSVFPMNRQELQAAIEKPAALADVQLAFEEHVIGNLLSEVQEQAGTLPLLQFVLDQLFERRHGHRLTLAAYHEMGGVRGALAKHAENTFTALPSEEHRRLTRVLFLRLIDPGKTEQELTRRRAELGEFALDDESETRLLNECIDVFVAARLLTTSLSDTTTMIEVSHEALIREWPRLMDWLREAREDMYLQQAISRDVAAWERSGKPKDRLYRGSQLREANTWMKRTRPSKSEAAFLRASTNQRAIALVLRIGVALLVGATTALASWLFLLLPTNPTLVTTLADAGPGSLRQDIDTASNGSTITFAPQLRGALMLTSSNLTFSRNLTLHGPGSGLTISSGTRGYGIAVPLGISVLITGLSFGNSILQKGSFIDNAGTLNLTSSNVLNTTTLGAGSAIIHNTGSLTLIDSQVSGNTTKVAGALNNAGSLTLLSSTVTHNTGGGIYNIEGGTLILTKKSVVSDNTADGPGSGIYNAGKLTLTDSMISHNIANHDTGGGIYNAFGTLIMNNSVVSSNTAIDSYGGGIDNQGEATVTGSIFSGNTAFGNQESHRGGGGIYNEGFLSIVSSSISNNTFSSNTQNNTGGGGVYNIGMLSITKSAIFNNSTSGGSGGAVFNDLAGTMSLTNSTLSGNMVSGGSGGGIASAGSEIDLIFCTVYGNTALDSGGGIFIAASNIQGNSSQGRVVMSNSLVAQNRAINGKDVAGVLVSGGYNFVQSSSGFVLVTSDAQPKTDLSGLITTSLLIDPQLQENGVSGQPPTWTHALLAGSFAIDRIPSALCHPDGITTDQRGVKRPQGAACDIGAYEFVSSP